MSKLNDSSAIKLFGKTIPLPTLNQQEALADHGLYSRRDAREDKECKEKQLVKDKQEDSSKDPTPSLKSSKKEETTATTTCSQDKGLKKPDKILPCPRCNSKETKFCYYNNYNVNQPRHFCKHCQRYWTAGGTMRNVPVGAGRRKTKTSSTLRYHHHIMISEAIRAAQASSSAYGIHRNGNENENDDDNNNHNAHVLTFASDSSVFNLFPSKVLPCVSGPYLWEYSNSIPAGFASSNSTTASTLGKHCRDDHNILTSPACSLEKGGTTLRIDDPAAGETAKSSMLATLVMKTNKNSTSNSMMMNSGALFDGFESKSSTEDQTNYRLQTTFSVLRANPAALSRSLNFHENT